jgi:hypothetical protein
VGLAEKKNMPDRENGLRKMETDFRIKKKPLIERLELF